MGTSKQTTILVLDDDKEMGAYLELALSRSGFRTIILSTTKNLDLGEAVDAALIDMCLKNGEDGLGVAIDLLDAGVPTAIMTGLPASAPTVRAARTAGVGMILQKPFSLKALKSAVAELTGGG